MNGHFVYRAYGRNDTLLYVGHTWQPGERLLAHEKSSPWWGAARVITVEPFMSAGAARLAESTAITIEQPLFNVTGTGALRPEPTVETHDRPARSAYLFNNRSHVLRDAGSAAVEFACGSMVRHGLYEVVAAGSWQRCSDCYQSHAQATA